MVILIGEMENTIRVIILEKIQPTSKWGGSREQIYVIELTGFS